MESSLLEQGLDLMLFGMGTVFVFLALLVVGTMLMSKFVGKYLPEAQVEDAPLARPQPHPSQVDTRTLTIIQEAIHQHRASQHST